MLRSIWDWLSWRKNVLRMKKGHSTMRIVFWYRAWETDKFYREKTETEAALKRDGWWKPSFWFP